MNGEIEENEEEVVKISEMNTTYLWLPNSVNPTDWKGHDVLSKGDIWRNDYFMTHIVDAKHVTDVETGRDGFTFKTNYVLQQKQNMWIQLQCLQ